MTDIGINGNKNNYVYNKKRIETYSVCMNGLHLSRVFVTNFLGVHMDSKLVWIIKVAKKCICDE